MLYFLCVTVQAYAFLIYPMGLFPGKSVLSHQSVLVLLFIVVLLVSPCKDPQNLPSVRFNEFGFTGADGFVIQVILHFPALLGAR